MSSSVSCAPASASRIGPDVVATSSSTVSKWWAVIVGHGPLLLDHVEDPFVLVVGVHALEHPGWRHRAQDVVDLQVVGHRAPPALGTTRKM